MKKYILLFSLLFNFCAWSQIDSTKKEEKQINHAFLETSNEESNIKNPKKAANLAILAPGLGLGQIYNQKYWKLPLIYGADAYIVYKIIVFSNTYTQLRDELYRRDLSKLHPEIKWLNTNKDLTTTATETIRTDKDIYRRKRDRMYLIAGGVYGLTILDAYVNAHLSSFNIDKKKSLTFKPSLVPTDQSLALGFSLKWSL